MVVPIVAFKPNKATHPKLKEREKKFLDKGNTENKKYKTNIRASNNFVHIKAGSFQMGSNRGGDDERPIHQVNIGYDFYIGKYEVTVGEFRKFINDTNYRTDAQKADGCHIYNGSSWNKKLDANWDNPYFSQSAKSPVVCVSHNDVKAYTKWLSQNTDKIYRLPTESEWEYVARAGTTTKYSFGNSESSLDVYAWHNGNSYSKTHEVGQKQPNQWGVYDIYGNAWEWCEDWYIYRYLNVSRDGSYNNNGPQKNRVLRGGAWNTGEVYLRSANRNWRKPTFSDNLIGFRLLLEY